jgi:CubicO group peptidase (beta-lactamase class C family)
MLIRFVPMYILIGCEGKSPLELIAVSWDSTSVASGEEVLMPSIRRFSTDTSVTMNIMNIGFESSIDLVAIDETLPQWLHYDTEFPVSLSLGESIDVKVFWDATHTDGVFSEELQLTHEGTDFLLAISGEIEPYVQLQLEVLPEVTESVEAEIQLQNIVGAAVAIVEGQEIIYLQGFGYADLESEIEVDPSLHRFRWASTAKSFAGVLAVQQYSAGVLDLDTDISLLYPEYTIPEQYFRVTCDLNSAPCSSSDAMDLPEDSPNTTLRMLLSHTGCIQHYSNGFSHPEPPSELRNDEDINTGMEWALDYWKDNPLICIPGSNYSYSTPSFNLAGVVLEQVTGLSYPELVLNGISDIVAADTIAPDYHWDTHPDRVTGYYLDSSTNAITRIRSTDISWKLAAGGFLSTPEDMARYCGGLLGDERRFIMGCSS